MLYDDISILDIEMSLGGNSCGGRTCINMKFVNTTNKDLCIDKNTFPVVPVDSLSNHFYVESVNTGRPAYFIDYTREIYLHLTETPDISDYYVVSSGSSIEASIAIEEHYEIEESQAYKYSYLAVAFDCPNGAFRKKKYWKNHTLIGGETQG